MPNPTQLRSTTGSGTSLALAFLSDNTAGNLLIATVGNGDGGDTLTSVGDSNGNTWAQATFIANTGIHTAIWYAMNSNAGANTVTANFSASEFSSSLVIAEYAGAELTSALDQVNTGSGFGTAIATANVTTTTADQLMIGIACCSEAGVTYTPDASYTERVDDAANRPFQYQDRTVNSTLTDNSTQTKSGGNANWAACIATFKLVPLPPNPLTLANRAARRPATFSPGLAR